MNSAEELSFDGAAEVKSSSEASDEPKTEKTGFPTPWKREDRRLNRINNNGQETI